jgi:hypothetical protein
MATKEDSASDREQKARLAVRRILEHVPLTLDAAIELERESVLSLKELFDQHGGQEDWDKLFSYNIGKNDPCGDEILRLRCADLIESALPPSPWRDYALQALRRPAPPSKEVLRHDGIEERNKIIVDAIYAAAEAGLSLTRNRAQRYTDGAHSACSLVAIGRPPRQRRRC